MAVVVGNRDNPIVQPVPTSIVCPEVPSLPPIEQVDVTPRPGFVWIQAEWNWVGEGFKLTHGHWERIRATEAPFIAGHWDTSSGRCVWIRGS